MGNTHCSSPEGMEAWKESMLEQFRKNCSLWEGPTLKFMEECLQWEGPQNGVGEEQGVAEMAHDEPTRALSPIPLCCSGGGGRENQELSLGRRQGLVGGALDLVLLLTILV